MNDAKPNEQYNLAAPDSLSIRVATRMRHQMFGMFMTAFAPTREDTVLDVGVTSDRSYMSSNYFEALYPWKDRVTATGLDDARFLEDTYPGLRFTTADACNLPFNDGSFDIVHSSAVLEHVGSYAKQMRMVAECLRVCRRGIFLTTPNRWFPIEFHTQLPFIHWLPKPLCRAIFRGIGLRFFADEMNLNLMTARELRRTVQPQSALSYQVVSPRLWGWPSNLILIATRAQER